MSYTKEDRLSTIADKVTRRVGAAVRSRREELRLTLRALAAKSGISSSMVSDIERGAKSPTVSTLAALAAALGVPISALVEAAPQAQSRIKVVRCVEQRAFVDPASGARRESFGPAVAGSNVEFLRYTLRPRSVAGPFPAHARGAIEHIHVATGATRVVVGGDEVTLAAGDSCSCHADAKHLFDNMNGDIEAILYVVIEQGGAPRSLTPSRTPARLRRA
jgi:transcriptional regulator with XRE-family HTH domain